MTNLFSITLCLLISSTSALQALHFPGNRLPCLETLMPATATAAEVKAQGEIKAHIESKLEAATNPWDSCENQTISTALYNLPSKHKDAKYAQTKHIEFLSPTTLVQVACTHSNPQQVESLHVWNVDEKNTLKYKYALQTHPRVGLISPDDMNMKRGIQTFNSLIKISNSIIACISMPKESMQCVEFWDVTTNKRISQFNLEPQDFAFHIAQLTNNKILLRTSSKIIILDIVDISRPTAAKSLKMAAYYEGDEGKDEIFIKLNDNHFALNNATHIEVYNTDLKRIATLEHGEVTALHQISDNVLISGNADGIIKIWDISSWQCMKEIEPDTELDNERIASIKKISDKAFVTIDINHKVTVFDIHTYEPLDAEVNESGAPRSFHLDCIRISDTRFTTAEKCSALTIFDIADNKLNTFTIANHPDAKNFLFSYGCMLNNAAIIFGDQQGRLHVFKISNTQQQIDAGNKLIMAAKAGDQEQVEQLLHAGALVNSKDPKGVTALMWAINNSHSTVAQMLIHHAYIQVDAQDNAGCTALMHASTCGNALVVEKLLNAHASVNIQDNDGQTALMAASMGGYNDIIEKLIAAGAHVNLQDIESDTALTLAALYNHLSTVKILLNAGADRSIKNNMDDTAYEIATRNTQLAIANMLQTHKIKRAPADAKGDTKSAAAASTESKRTTAEATCAKCAKPEALKQCSGCRTLNYCSPECQKAHWPMHKVICKELAKVKGVKSW